MRPGHRSYRFLFAFTMAASAVGAQPGHTGPFVEVRDARPIHTRYSGDTLASQTLAGGFARPLSLASADFDEDGTPDLVSGYATAAGAGLRTVRDYGADAVVDYKNQKFEDVAHEVDLVFDLIGGATQARSFAVLKPGGALISTVQEPDKARAAEKHLKAERYRAMPNGADLAEIGALIDAGKVKVVVAKTFPLAQPADAHRFLENAHPIGKVVLITG